MAEITIVGLGPGDVGELTVRAVRAIADARLLILRTERHPAVSQLSEVVPALPTIESCDDLYESHTEFTDVYAAIAERVVSRAQEHVSVVYAMPGSPWVGEQTTRLVLDAAEAAGISVDVVDGLSFVEPAFAAVGVDPMDGAQVVDAMLLTRQYAPKVEVSLPLLVAQVYARWLASDLKLTLLTLYPPEHPVKVLRAAGSEAQQVIDIALHELDNGGHFDHLTSVYVPPQAAGRSLSDLVEIVAHLRAPDGCPWDREQTLASLRSDLMSETAEVLEAIDADEVGDDAGANIAEELGDLLLVCLMLVQIGSEEGRFQLGDVTQGIVEKLIRRHPHVFGELAVSGSGEVLANWDAIKRQEKAAKGIAPSPLDGVPASLPALEKARQYQSKARKAKLLDRAALAQSNPQLMALIDEADAGPGALLWQLTAIATEREINLEDALREYVVSWKAQIGKTS